MKQHIKTLIAGGVLAPVLIGMAMRGPLEDGYAAYQRGDYAKVMRLFRPLADQGEATALFNLGVRYDNRRGVSQDYAQAFAWYRPNAQSIGGLIQGEVSHNESCIA